MYRVIGKRDHLCHPAAAHMVDRLLGECIGIDVIGALAYVLPDGVILERQGQLFETKGRELRAVNMLEPGHIVTQPSPNAAGITRAEYWREIEAVKEIAKKFFKE